MSKIDGLCIQCKLPALPRCHTEAGKREFYISGMCEVCFDALFAEAEAEDEDEDEFSGSGDDFLNPDFIADDNKLTELQYAETGEGPWKLYIYGADGFYRKAPWFRKGKMKYPDEEIPISEAKSMSNIAIMTGGEVRVCDGGDNLVFHSRNGKILYGDGFWEAVTA